MVFFSGAADQVLLVIANLAKGARLRGLILDLRGNISGIGVAPDYYLPLTAQDLSTGHDPDIAKALTLLGG